MEWIGGGWDEVLREEIDKPKLVRVARVLVRSVGSTYAFPPPSQTFRAFELTPFVVPATFDELAIIDACLSG